MAVQQLLSQAKVAQSTQPQLLMHVKAKLLTILLVFGLTTWAMAQQDSTKVEQDEPKTEKKKKEKKPFKPVLKGIKIGTDLYPIGLTIFDPGFTGGELNTELVFNNKFFINVDYGFQDANRNGENGSFVYNNTGSYWRVGIDYNFMHKSFSEQAIFVGTRFAGATFDHDASYTSSSTIWGDQQENIQVNGVSANWLELNFGMKIKVIKNLHLSTILRAKILMANLDESQLAVSEIPGFGINRNSITGAIGYRLSYMIPITKTTKSKRPKQAKPKKGEEKELEEFDRVLPTDNDEGEEEDG